MNWACPADAQVVDKVCYFHLLTTSSVPNDDSKHFNSMVTHNTSRPDAVNDDCCYQNGRCQIVIKCSWPFALELFPANAWVSLSIFSAPFYRRHNSIQTENCQFKWNKNQRRKNPFYFFNCRRQIVSNFWPQSFFSSVRANQLKNENMFRPTKRQNALCNSFFASHRIQIISIVQMEFAFVAISVDAKEFMRARAHIKIFQRFQMEFCAGNGCHSFILFDMARKMRRHDCACVLWERKLNWNRPRPCLRHSSVVNVKSQSVLSIFLLVNGPRQRQRERERRRGEIAENGDEQTQTQNRARWKKKSIASNWVDVEQAYVWQIEQKLLRKKIQKKNVFFLAQICHKFPIKQSFFNTSSSVSVVSHVVLFQIVSLALVFSEYSNHFFVIYFLIRFPMDSIECSNCQRHRPN